MAFRRPRSRLTRARMIFLFACVLAVHVPARAADNRTPSAPIAGVVRDPSGAVVPGAIVQLTVAGRAVGECLTDAAGYFLFNPVPPGPAVVSVTSDGFRTESLRVATSRPELEIRLRPTAVTELVTVRGRSSESSTASSALKTLTPLRDVPQAVSIVSQRQIAEQGMQGLADLVRFVPGTGMAQGEGNRDAVVFRGHASTADFLVDGLRDDVQYYRDLYNVEQVEVLRGANGMLLGRGGAGGVMNRVTRQANWGRQRDVTLQLGSFDDRRMTVDAGGGLNSRLAARVTGMFERADSYRQGVDLERFGVNPTVAVILGGRTTLRAGYEYFHDARTADRGVPSYQGRPLSTAASSFFGNAAQSTSNATAHVLSAALEHRVGRVTLRSRTRYADYDKFYQNVFPGTVAPDGAQVSVSAYNHGTRRQNLLHQADLVFDARTGAVSHGVSAGVELARQETDNVRETGYFAAGGVESASTLVPVADPGVRLSATFKPSPTDANTTGVAGLAAAFVQDEIVVSHRIRTIVGLRYESFSLALHNNRTDADLRASDGLVSPRLGLVFRAAEPLSLYGSYGVTYLPRAGEQLGSLTPTNRALEPEAYRNYEAGVKWNARPGLSAALAVYQLERRNVAVVDPTDPTRMLLVNGQRARGVEASLGGRVTGRWTVSAAYAFQDGAITRSQSSTARAGARLAQLPAHSVAVWNRYDWTRRWGTGLGVIHRGGFFASTDNLVTVPGFTRVDAAAFMGLTRRLAAQVNVENLFDRSYFASAHSNNNIMPGSPRAVRLSVSARF